MKISSQQIDAYVSVQLSGTALVLDIAVKGAGHGSLTEDLLAQLFEQSNGNRSVTAKACCDAGFWPQDRRKVPDCTSLDAHVLGRAQLADQPRRILGDAQG